MSFLAGSVDFSITWEGEVPADSQVGVDYQLAVSRDVAILAREQI